MKKISKLINFIALSIIINNVHSSYSMVKIAAPAVGYGIQELTRHATLILGSLLLSSKLLASRLKDRVTSVAMPEAVKKLYQSKVQPAAEVLQKLNFEQSIEAAIKVVSDKVSNFKNKHKWKTRIIGTIIAYKLAKYLKEKAEEKINKKNENLKGINNNNVVYILNSPDGRIVEGRLLDLHRSEPNIH